MKKKGELTTSEVFGMILLALSLVVLIGLAVQFGERADKGYNSQLCRTSVVANSKLNTPILGDGVWPIKCPTRYMYFDTDGFIEESGDYKAEILFSTKAKDIQYDNKPFSDCMNDKSITGSGDLKKEDICKIRNINTIIMQRHYECWEQFGRGELALFNRADTDRQCVICSVYDFSEEMEKKYGSYYSSEVLPERHTLDYMMRTKGPLDRNITYYELTMDPMDIFDQPYFDYSFDESYASVFIANNDNYIQTKMQQIGQFFKDPITKALPFIKSTDPDGFEKFFLNTIEFSPETLVVRECDVLVEQ